MDFFKQIERLAKKLLIYTSTSIPSKTENSDNISLLACSCGKTQCDCENCSCSCGGQCTCANKK